MGDLQWLLKAIAQLTSRDAVCVDRTLFRSFDENADGTVSQHEFRKGIENLGIVVSDDEFAELMETLDEVQYISRTNSVGFQIADDTALTLSCGTVVPQDNSNEIDYNEFANSGVMGGKFFAARNPKGFSGMNTQKEVVEKRRMEYKEL